MPLKNETVIVGRIRSKGNECKNFYLLSNIIAMTIVDVLLSLVRTVQWRV